MKQFMKKKIIWLIFHEGKKMGYQPNFFCFFSRILT